MTYGGSAIFGQFNKQSGPSRPYRALRSQLPTVDGARVYRLGKDPVVWTVRGRLIGASLAALNGSIAGAIAMQDGQTRTFIDNGGTAFLNCILTDFRSVGPFTSITLPNGTPGATVEVQGTIEQLSPAF